MRTWAERPTTSSPPPSTPPPPPPPPAHTHARARARSGIHADAIRAAPSRPPPPPPPHPRARHAPPTLPGNPGHVAQPGSAQSDDPPPPRPRRRSHAGGTAGGAPARTRIRIRHRTAELADRVCSRLLQTAGQQVRPRWSRTMPRGRRTASLKTPHRTHTRARAHVRVYVWPMNHHPGKRAGSRPPAGYTQPHPVRSRARASRQVRPAPTRAHARSAAPSGRPRA